MMLRSATSVLAGLALAGCVGKDYARPEIALTERFAHEQAGDPLADPARAWERFNDPALVRLLARSEGSLAVREALARLDEAQALRRQATGSYGPQVDAVAGAERQRTTANGTNPQGGKTQNRLSTGFDLSWEIDLVGGLERTREASDAFLAGSQEQVRAVRLIWQAEVADAYLAWRHAQVKATAIRARAETSAESARLARSRADLGAVDEATAARAEAQAAALAAAVPQAEAQPRRDLQRLALLLATDTPALERELGRQAPPAPPAALPPGLPSDLLRRRPDIRAAERDLAYTTARIGVAESDLWPRFFITGSAGLESIESKDLFDSGSRYWSFGPSLRWSIFSYGRVQAGVAAAEAQERQALVRYERAVRTAITETELALVGIRAAIDAERAATASLKAAEAARAIATARSEAGFGWDTRLEADLLWAGAVATHADTAADLTRAHVAFIKAVGGGFQDPPAVPARSATAGVTRR